MKPYKPMIICDACDTVHSHPALSDGEQAICRTCGATIVELSRPSLPLLAALAIGAAISYGISLTFPVLAVSITGERHDISLWRLSTEWARGLWSPMAALLVTVIIAAPALQIAGLFLLITASRMRLYGQKTAILLRLLKKIHPWNLMAPASVAVVLTAVLSAPFIQVDLKPAFWSLCTGSVLLWAASPVITRRYPSSFCEFRFYLGKQRWY